MCLYKNAYSFRGPVVYLCSSLSNVSVTGLFSLVSNSNYCGSFLHLINLFKAACCISEIMGKCFDDISYRSAVISVI